MKIDWRGISACNHCSNYNKKESYCNEQKRELTIYDELKGCEKIIFTGRLSLELFKEIPKDSILRELSINQLSRSTPELENTLTSKVYGDYFTESKTINSETNLAKSEREGKIISFEKFKEAEKKFKDKKLLNIFLHQSDHLLP
jgi:hypothetical protein